jgi:thioredoxin
VPLDFILKRFMLWVGKMINLNDENFDAKILNSSGLALVDFTAAWCGPCKRQTPILEQFAKENPQVKVFSVDTDESLNLVDRYSIKAAPTLLLFKDGVKVETKAGLTSLATLNSLIKTHS